MKTQHDNSKLEERSREKKSYVCVPENSVRRKRHSLFGEWPFDFGMERGKRNSGLCGIGASGGCKIPKGEARSEMAGADVSLNEGGAEKPDIPRHSGGTRWARKGRSDWLGDKACAVVVSQPQGCRHTTRARHRTRGQKYPLQTISRRFERPANGRKGRGYREHKSKNWIRELPWHVYEVRRYI